MSGKCPCCGFDGPADKRACVAGGEDFCRSCPAPGECPNGAGCIGPGAGARWLDGIERDPLDTNPAPGRDLAVQVETALAAPGGARALTAVAAAQRIHGCVQMLRELSTAAENQIMEWFWVIRSHCPDRAAFDAFLVAQGLDADFTSENAWAMAIAWDASRRSRLMRAQVTSEPMRVVEVVQQFIANGQEERLERLDETDAEVAAIIAAPVRTRHKKVRALLEAKRQRSLDLVGGEAPRAPEHSGEKVNAGAVEVAAGMEELQDVVRRLDRLGSILPELLLADGANRARRERIPSITDLAMGSLERIADAASAAGERYAGS